MWNARAGDSAESHSALREVCLFIIAFSVLTGLSSDLIDSDDKDDPKNSGVDWLRIPG